MMTTSKSNRFNARASRFLARLRNVLIWRFLRTWTYDDEFSFLFLKLNKILKNSTPGKVACIWHIERVQIDAIKFERTQIHFFSDAFTAVAVVDAKAP